MFSEVALSDDDRKAFRSRESGLLREGENVWYDLRFFHEKYNQQNDDGTINSCGAISPTPAKNCGGV